MPDLGLNVLLKGKNMARLLGGLWVALRISLLSVAISIPLGILLGVLMTRQKSRCKSHPAGLSRNHPHYAADGAAVPCVFRHDHARCGLEPLGARRASIIVFVLWGTAEMSDLGERRADLHPEAAVREQPRRWV